ncbi:hypothetical protein F5884DRAFT_744486 [Xylogone sp. PMI_703]|nr:hypothetical protein F5884DRAFT_744486 [Xylogone sp. PMI_703]
MSQPLSNVWNHFRIRWDIIALVQIAWTLTKALVDSRGSAKEYQSLMKELQAFHRALLEVAALWQNYENSPELNELGTIIKDKVKEWGDALLTFHLKIDKKYGKNLSPGGSGNWVKDTSKKVCWLKEKEDILNLRKKLQTASDTVTMLTLAAIGKSNKLDSTVLVERAERVYGLSKESAKQVEKQMAQLRLMDEKLDTQAKTSNMILATVKSGAVYFLELKEQSKTQIHTIATDIKNLLVLLQSHIRSQQAMPRGLGGCWKQAPVSLEDAMGFVIPIPLELVNPWDMFDTIIAKRFEKHPGHRKIQRGEFAIEEDSTGREVSRMLDLTMCLRPGQKIDTSVIFSKGDADSNHCPRCRAKSAASSEARTQYSSCQMWFQRIIEIDAPDATGKLGKAPLSLDQPAQPAKLQQRHTGPALSPADFQRVRLMRKHMIDPTIVNGIDLSPSPTSLSGGLPQSLSTPAPQQQQKPQVDSQSPASQASPKRPLYRKFSIPPMGKQYSPDPIRTFKCDQCFQSFARNHDLKRHKRMIHLAMRPLPCRYCERSFPEEDALEWEIFLETEADLNE